MSGIADFCIDGPFNQDRRLKLYGTHLKIVGWAILPNHDHRLAVYAGDHRLGYIIPSESRADVSRVFSWLPQEAAPGFNTSVDLPRGLVEANPNLRVRVAIELHGEVRKEDSWGVVQMESHMEEAGVPEAPRPENQQERLDETAPSLSEFRFSLDSPSTSENRAINPSIGPLVITGWAFARSSVSTVEVFVDQTRVGRAHYGIARRDVAAAFPGWPNSLRSGFTFQCPSRILLPGTRHIELRLRTIDGHEFIEKFAVDILTSREEGSSDIRRRMNRSEVDYYAALLQTLSRPAAFQIVLDVRLFARPGLILTTLRSIRTQCFDQWELVILVGPDGQKEFLCDMARELGEAFLDKVCLSTVAAWDVGPSSRSERRLVGFLKPGDELSCDALLHFSLAAALHPQADLFYADEITRDPGTDERRPFFKPDWSPDLLLSTNYFGRPLFIDRTLLIATGGHELALERGEYDLALRCSEMASEIHHLRRLLCSTGPGPESVEQEQLALQNAVHRRSLDADILPGKVARSWRVRRATSESGRVSIIIPTCGTGDYVVKCIQSLRSNTAYSNFEVVCIDNVPKSMPDLKRWIGKNADTVVSAPGDFNWARFNNVAARRASGDFFLFLNDDTEFIEDTWLDSLVEHARRPEVGIVGPRMLFPDGTVQHAGMFLCSVGIARHAFRFAAATDPGYFGLALTQRNVIAVTGACMMMRRGVFELLGGFAEKHSVVANDLDFCLRSHKAALLTVYTPHSTLIHHELASRHRLSDVYDVEAFRSDWGSVFTAGDPYFNPGLSKNSDDYAVEHEPSRAVFPAYPLFNSCEIKNILVIRLDHIGDFVVSLPAIRLLKKVFPLCMVHVLGAPASKAIALSSGAVDSFIEFELFHARSSLGKKDPTNEQISALKDELARRKFDLAVDFRKYPDTRGFLLHSRARYLAGFDSMGAFPFLDVSVEWEADSPLQRKRSNAVADLVLLVQALANAAGAERPEPSSIPKSESFRPRTVPKLLRHLRRRAIVAIHPGVGNPMRQWPEEHFAAIIDLLVEKKNVHTILIGSSEDLERAESILSKVARPEATTSLVGLVGLEELTSVLERCALFIGNNSGPQHIAAMLGVPTIGIHSGVVDAAEWGPVGTRAVAVQRDMVCSPCYLERKDDCFRNLACLKSLDPQSVWELAKVFLGGTARSTSRAGT